MKIIHALGLFVLKKKKSKEMIIKQVILAGKRCIQITITKKILNDDYNR